MEKSAGEKFSRFCAGGVLVLLLGFMAALTVMSFLGTYSVSTGGGEGEVLSYAKDNILLNILFTFAFLLLLLVLSRLLEKVSAKKLTVLLLVWTAAFSSALVCSAKLKPSEDAFIIAFSAQQAALGDTSALDHYFCFFPYQLGLVLYEEIIYRIFYFLLPTAPEGFAAIALQLLNVLYTALTFFALVKISGLLFKNERAEKLTALLLFFCLQPMFFITFIYGNTPGLCFGVLAAWMFLLFTEREETKYALLCILFLCLAVILKLNTLIFVLALGIVWLLSILRKPTLRSSLLLVLMIASVLLFKPLPQKLYEARLGTNFGKGIPQSGWLAMGLNEGFTGPGWYDPTYTTTNFLNSDFDRQVSGDIAKKAISERLSEFSENPGEAWKFFGKKFSSQWNEPSYESLWLNQRNTSYSSSGKFYTFLCEDHADGIFAFMNIFQQAVFLAFTAGLVLLLLRKRETGAVILPLVILGGMLYHLLFEAKSQYALGYFVLMMPTAAYALDCSVELSPLAPLKGELRPQAVRGQKMQTKDSCAKMTPPPSAPPLSGEASARLKKERSGENEKD